MKCEKCGSSLIFVDAEKDLIFCKSCGYVEEASYREIPEELNNKYRLFNSLN